MSRKTSKKPVEIVLAGEVDDWEQDVLDRLLEVEPGGECTLYFDCSGGSVYGALAVLALLRHRSIRARAVVLGECSSAALLVFAGCTQRLVTRYSVFLFHRMHWESEKRVTSTEAISWAKHFAELEGELDELQIRLFGRAEPELRAWLSEDRFVTGAEMIEAGLAELMEIG
jgi:ATP-dependent protease ClpP protease subunit